MEKESCKNVSKLLNIFSQICNKKVIFGQKLSNLNGCVNMRR